MWPGRSWKYFVTIEENTLQSGNAVEAAVAGMKRIDKSTCQYYWFQGRITNSTHSIRSSSFV